MRENFFAEKELNLPLEDLPKSVGKESENI